MIKLGVVLQHGGDHPDADQAAARCLLSKVAHAKEKDVYVPLNLGLFYQDELDPQSPSSDTVAGAVPQALFEYSILKFNGTGIGIYHYFFAVSFATHESIVHRHDFQLALTLFDKKLAMNEDLNVRPMVDTVKTNCPTETIKVGPSNFNHRVPASKSLKMISSYPLIEKELFLLGD